MKVRTKRKNIIGYASNIMKISHFEPLKRPKNAIFSGIKLAIATNIDQEPIWLFHIFHVLLF